MASTGFQLRLTVILFTLAFAIATTPTRADGVPYNATTVTANPYHESQTATYPTYRIEVGNSTAIKRLYNKMETVTSGSTMRAAHCSFKEAADVDLGALLGAGQDAMVTLVAGESHLIAHRAVLAARSSVFAAMLCDSTQEASSSVVAVPDVEGPVLRQLVAYLYTLQAPHLSGMAPQLLAVADKFSLSALKAECEAQVASQLSVETAAATAVLAIKHSTTALRQAAIAFIKAHTNQVTATKGWADAVHHHPQEVIEVYRLLAELPVETSTPAMADTQPTTITTSLPQSSHGWTPVAAAPVSQPTTIVPSLPNTTSQAQTPVAAALPSPPTNAPEEDAVSHLRRLPAEEKGRRLRGAAVEGRVGDVEALLAAGVDVGARDRKWRTALHWAALEGHVMVARRLVEAGAEVDATDDYQQTPLYWAAGRGQVAVVRLLLASSANPNASAENGWTPLHRAAWRGQAEAVAALLQGGADRGATTNVGSTPLDFARGNNHQAVINLLT